MSAQANRRPSVYWPGQLTIVAVIAAGQGGARGDWFVVALVAFTVAVSWAIWFMSEADQ